MNAVTTLLPWKGFAKFVAVALSVAEGQQPGLGHNAVLGIVNGDAGITQTPTGKRVNDGTNDKDFLLILLSESCLRDSY